MPSANPQLDTIAKRLDGIRGDIKSLFVLDGVSRLVVALCVFVAVTFLFDWLFILPAPFRLLMMMAGLGGIGWIIARRLVYPMSVKISDDDIALFVERQYPELKDRLISAIQLARLDNTGTEDRVAGFNSPQLVDALIGDAMQVTEHLDFNRVLIRGHVLKIAAWAAALILVLGGSAIARTDLAKIYANRLVGGKAKWPQRTQLQVVGFDENRTKTFARGDDITIAVDVKKGDPGKVFFKYSFKNEKGDVISSGVDQMAKIQERYTQQFPHLSGPFDFSVEGGDDESEMYHVETQNPPSLLQLEAFFEYPEYLEKPNTPGDRPEQAGNFQVPIGTKVKLIGHSNEDLAESQIIVGVKNKEKTSAMTIEKDPAGVPRLLTATFPVDEAYTEYQIVLKAKNSLTNRDPIRYSVKGIPDMKPTIQVYEPSGDETITEICKRPVKVITTDDNAVAEVRMEVRLVGSKTTEWSAVAFGADQNRPKEYSRQAAKITSEYILDVQPLKAAVGDFIEVRFVAKDYRTVPEPNQTTSRVYRFSVVSINALESELQQAIEKIKQGLTQQLAKENLAYERAGKVEEKFSKIDKLGPEQQGEVRGLAFEQQGIGEKLDGARRDIDRIRNRGLWNGVFDERAAGALQGAVDELESVAGYPNNPEKPVSSKMASTLLITASRAASKERLPLFGQVRSAQGQVIDGITRALKMLDSWATYQEIISLVRRAQDAVKNGKKEMLEK